MIFFKTDAIVVRCLNNIWQLGVFMAISRTPTLPKPEEKFGLKHVPGIVVMLCIFLALQGVMVFVGYCCVQDTFHLVRDWAELPLQYQVEAVILTPIEFGCVLGGLLLPVFMFGK